MAIAFIGGNKNSAASTATTLTATYTPTNGNIVVVFMFFTSTVSALVVKDNNNVTLTTGPSEASASTRCSCFYYVATGGPTSFVATWTTARLPSMVILEYSGAASVNPTGVTATATSASASISLTTTGLNSFIVAGLGGNTNTPTGTVGNQREQNVAGAHSVGMDNTTASSGATLTCTATLTSSLWAAAAVELLAPVLPSFASLTDMLSEYPGFDTTKTQGFLSLAIAESGLGDNVELPPQIL